MSGPIPFLGSKISLISKSEIRYEGILYTIDAQESIIALAKVRSFGTEDRPTEMPVPARDEVYEYIIFRGTDIKKIEVCDTPKQPTLPGGLHNDPAIVQHSAPAVPSSFQAAPFSRQSLGPIGGGLGGLSYGAAPYGQSMTQQGIPGAGFPVASTSQPRSRSSTPTARKSPVSDAGVQVSPPPSRDDKKRSPQQQRQPPQDRQRNGNQGQGGRRSSGQGGQQGMGPPQQPQHQPPQQNHHQHQHQHHQHYQHQHQHNQYYQYQYNRGGMRGRGRGRSSGPRGRGTFNQGNRQRQFQDRQLFEKDYDFEQANEEFEELKNQLAKTKITENGDKKDDLGQETAGTGTGTGTSTNAGSTGAGEEVDEQICYDKTKSFFDSISCEAIERSKGKSQRPDWRLERKINVETFGVSSARRGYYPRGRGGYYRGGYYRNYNYNQGYYRGGGGYRGGRGGSRGGNINGIAQRGGTAAGASASPGAGAGGAVEGGAGAGSSYASAVRNSAEK